MVGSLKIAPTRAPAATASFRTFPLDVLAVPLLTNIVQHICIVFRTTFFLKDGAPPFSARGSLPSEKQKTTQNQNMSINLLSYSTTSLHRVINKKIASFLLRSYGVLLNWRRTLDVMTTSEQTLTHLCDSDQKLEL